VTYTYDGNGDRVKKSNGRLYWYGAPGIVAESDLSGNLTAEYIFFDGERVSRRDLPSGTVHYYFSDHLKTASVITDSAGNIKAESDYYPWGGELQFTASDSGNHYKFTGKERDTESNLDYFGARYYSNGLGRFISADWSSAPVPVPYADFTDPQSLNQYSYVRNIPTSRADLDGHDGTVTLGPFIVTPQLLNSIQNIPSDLEAAAHSFWQFMTSGPVGPPMLPSPNPNCSCPAAQQQDNPDSNNNNSFRSNEQGRDAEGKFVSKQPGQTAPGSAAEKEGLDSIGAEKNNSEILNGTKRDGTIPETGQHVEVKSGETISNTKQLQKMGQAAMDKTGQPLKVVTTNPNVSVTKKALQNPNLQIEPMKNNEK
jgi:RHS repeat-associated protein